MRKLIITLLLCFKLCWTIDDENKLSISIGSLAIAQNGEKNTADYMNSLNNGNTYLPGTDGKIIVSNSSGNISFIHMSTINVPSTYVGSTSSGNGNGFLGWLSTGFSNVGDAISDFFSGLFSTGDDGGGEMENEEQYIGNYEWTYIDSDWFEPADPFYLDDTFLDDPFFNPGDWDLMGDLGTYHDIYNNNYTVDCAGVVNGSAYIGACNICIGGTTGITNCPSPSQTDTLKPTKIPCDSLAHKADSILRLYLSPVENTPQMNDLRNKAGTRKFEVGFAIERTVPANTPVYVVANYDTSGAQRTVSITVGPNTVATVHLHPAKDSFGITNVDGPSPRDIYQLFDDWRSFVQRRHIADYMVTGDSAGHDFAIMITDTSKFQYFLNNPLDSIIDMRDSILVGGVMLLNPQKAKWYGNLKTSSSLYAQYFKAYTDFKNEGYKKNMLENFANVYMLSQVLKIGIRMYQKDENGHFKELKFYEETDSNNKKHKKISISDCE